MKHRSKYLLVLAILMAYNPIFSQSNQWTWMNGDSTIGSHSSYGAYGTFSDSNHPCGRYGAATWKDKSGNFWLLGGQGAALDQWGYLNDLWKYKPGSNQWGFIKGNTISNKAPFYGTKGVASPQNRPGARTYANTWVDTTGKFWLFGGTEGIRWNDLWKYDTAINQWTWMSGDTTASSNGFYGTQGIFSSLNKPGGRTYSCNFTDTAGNLWLYGGGALNGFYSDLWKFDVSINQWAWMKGDTTLNNRGRYGIKGIPSPNNKPKARQLAVSWTDKQGNFWFFGGQNYYPVGLLNDLWKYDVKADSWTWMKGDSVINGMAFYGTQHVASTANTPAGRQYSTTWVDTAGNLWLFGGYGIGSSVFYSSFNDLWKYDVSANNWIWIKGDSIPVDIKNDQYGVLGVPSFTNTPGARRGGFGWVDSLNNLYLQGGMNNNGAYNDYDDLWKFNIQASEWTWIKGDTLLDQHGVYGVTSNPLVSNAIGARAYSSTWTDSLGNLWLFGGNGITEDYGGILDDMWRYDITTHEWKWIKGNITPFFTPNFGVKGVSSPANTPGSRSNAATWTDKQHNLWLFSGFNYATGSYSDLWKFSLTTNEWTWVNGIDSGSVNIWGTKGVYSYASRPASRIRSMTWTDTAAGIFWLFGGDNYSDLWKYNIALNQWQWVHGDTIAHLYGRYGIKGIPSATNIPGSRQDSYTWTDSLGNLWLFGGLGNPASPHSPGYGTLNDLWEFDISTSMWTWISGDSTWDSPGIFGIKNVPSSQNAPGGKTGGPFWKDKQGNFWLLGGIGYWGYYNDFWKYNPTTDEWTWMGGDTTANHKGIYGSKGLAAPDNRPGAQEGSVTWTDLAGNFWLLGGEGYDAHGYGGALNDLWTFNLYTILPVNLFYFKGEIKNHISFLNWKVENEKNFEKYEIERSLDGHEFSRLGTIKAHNAQVYSYQDDAKLLTPQRLYYRLKMIDKDGTYKYSNVVLLIVTSNEFFTIYPNPTNLLITIKSNFKNGITFYQLINEAGQVVISKKVNRMNVLKVPVSHLDKGLYMLKVFGDDNVQSGKVIIE